MNGEVGDFLSTFSFLGGGGYFLYMILSWLISFHLSPVKWVSVRQVLMYIIRVMFVYPRHEHVIFVMEVFCLDVFSVSFIPLIFVTYTIVIKQLRSSHNKPEPKKCPKTFSSVTLKVVLCSFKKHHRNESFSLWLFDHRNVYHQYTS